MENSEELPKKPRFLSKLWWKHFFSALKFWKYDARDVAVWNLSSWMTLFQIFGITKLLQLVPAWVTLQFSMVGGFIKVLAAKVWVFAATAAVGVFEVLHP